MGDLSNASSNLSRNWTEAQKQWTETNSKWRDNKGSQFENGYWSTFNTEVPNYIEALHELMEAIRESEQKISD